MGEKLRTKVFSQNGVCFCRFCARASCSPVILSCILVAMRWYDLFDDACVIFPQSDQHVREKKTHFFHSFCTEFVCLHSTASATAMHAQYHVGVKKNLYNFIGVFPRIGIELKFVCRWSTIGNSLATDWKISTSHSTQAWKSKSNLRKQFSVSIWTLHRFRMACCNYQIDAKEQQERTVPQQ